MSQFSDYYWRIAELDAAIIQKEEYFMRGTITTNFSEVAEEVAEFSDINDIILPQKSFFVNGSQTIH